MDNASPTSHETLFNPNSVAKTTNSVSPLTVITYLSPQPSQS